MVLHVHPVPHLLAIAVDRDRPALQSVDDGERDQLFGKLVGTVVVRAVRYRDRKTIGAVIRPDEVIAGGLARRVG